jgi:sortase A
MLKKIIPWILIISGLVLICSALYQRIETRWQQNQLVKQYERYSQDIQNGSAELSEPKTGKTVASDSGSAVKLQKLQNPDEQDNKDNEARELPAIIGILQIPKIGLKVAIGEGSGSNAMRYTVGHFPDTAKPGDTGNFALIGHRSYRYGQFFNRLDELSEGDLIKVKKGKQTFTYSITETMVVNPEDVWVLDATSDATITLVTCTPIRVATHRLIVKGILEHKK